MLTDVIKGLNLTSDLADEFFPNIKADSYQSDQTFLALMRVLLRNRIPKEETATMRIVNWRPRWGSDNDANYNAFIAQADMESKNKITFVECTSDIAQKINALLEERGLPGHENMALMSRVVKEQEETKKKAFPNANFWCCHEKANTVVVVENLGMHAYRQYAILWRNVYFSNAFKENPMTEDEVAMLKCLTAPHDQGSKNDEFIRYINKVEQEYDFKSAVARKAVSILSASMYKGRKKALENAIQSANNRLHDIHVEMGRLLADREEKRILLAGINTYDRSEEDGALSDYLRTNCAITLGDYSDGHLYYWAAGDLTYWDETDAECNIKTFGSNVYEGCSDYSYDKHKFRKLLEAIFIDRTVKVQICCCYHLEYSGDSINITPYPHGKRPPELSNHLCNPHGMNFSCLGTHYQPLSAALQEGDIPGAMDVTISAACELNLVDVSTEYFSRWLCSNNEKCLRLSDGTLMTCSEYLEAL